MVTRVTRIRRKQGTKWSAMMIASAEAIKVVPDLVEGHIIPDLRRKIQEGMATLNTSRTRYVPVGERWDRHTLSPQYGGGVQVVMRAYAEREWVRGPK